MTHTSKIKSLNLGRRGHKGRCTIKNVSLVQAVNIYPVDIFLLVYFERNSPRVSLAQGFLMLKASLRLYRVRYP